MKNRIRVGAKKVIESLLLFTILIIMLNFSTSNTFAAEVSNGEIQNKESFIRILDDSMDPLLIDDNSLNQDYEMEPFGNGAKPKKYIYRSNLLKVVYAGEAAGLTTAANLLEHSLADSPADLSYASGTSMSNQIKNSSEYKAILKTTKANLDKATSSSYSKISSTTLNSTNDLKLAYNKVSYKVTANKKSGKWTIKIVFSDTYDFAYASWKEYSGLGSTAVTIVNNYGATAQSVGAIVPYDIDITVTSTYTN